MLISRLKGADFSETALRITGVGLAGASLFFAVGMALDPTRAPQISGVEHLAIYSKPATLRARRERWPDIDYAPVGSTRRDGASLQGYEIVEASQESALLRLPDGALKRVAPRARLDNLGAVISIYQRGGMWTVATDKGFIREQRSRAN